MSFARLVLPGLLVLPACGRPTPDLQGSGELEPTRANLVRAAREVMDAARYCALVTVDAEGRPRARTVAPLPQLSGERPLEVWIATRPASRKVAELTAEPRVVLYYFDAQRLEYATLSGVARLVANGDEFTRRRASLSKELYPDWPEDCVLIEVETERVEVQGRGLAPDPLTWRPAALDLDAPRPREPADPAANAR